MMVGWRGCPLRDLGIVLLLLCHAAQGQEAAHDWAGASEIHPGVRLAHKSATEPRPMDVYCLRVDARNPAVRFHTTGRTEPWEAGATETRRATTREFMRRARAAGLNMIAAINGDAFRPWPAPFDKETPSDLAGLAVADGVVVSPATGSPSFMVYEDGATTITKTTEATNLARVMTAVSGFSIVLENGAVTAEGEDVHPRTGIGISKDGGHVYLMVIDGRRHASEGATTGEVGRWLAHFGAHTGVNLDGGGSTTMALLEGEDVHVINNPVGNGTNWLKRSEEKERELYKPTERTNGNNLGVVVVGGE